MSCAIDEDCEMMGDCHGCNNVRPCRVIYELMQDRKRLYWLAIRGNMDAAEWRVDHGQSATLADAIDWHMEHGL